MLILFGCLIFQDVPILFEEPLSPRIANYQIDVRYDMEHKSLEAELCLLWHNQTGVSQERLPFHLYLNGFRNTESTFMKESGGSHRGNKIDDDGFGFIDVSKVEVGFGEVSPDLFQSWQVVELPEAWTDVSETMQFLQPDDENDQDKTVMEIALPQALEPNQKVFVKMVYKAKLPEPPFARTGAKKEYFFVGQWFPKIGVFWDGEWNCHQFHHNSEFFADFGVYDVRMTVPASHILGATGIEVSVTDAGDGMKTHFYHAEDVHDFAWTGSSDFVEFKGQAQDVAIRALVQKDHVAQGQRHVDAAIVSVEYFQDHYGDYPFPNLTVVDPRRGAGGSGGMEYPTLITAGTYYGMPEGFRPLELVIIHEFGHNFWYHLLASNEFEESWLDEGINTYTEMVIMHDTYGPEADTIDMLGLAINDYETQWMQYRTAAGVDPMRKNAWEYMNKGSYGVNSYARPGVTLWTLEKYLGRETMQRIIQTYVERFSFKHPTSEDFVAIASEVAEQDLSWFFDPIINGRATVDYKVDYVISERIKEASGFDINMDTQDPESWTLEDQPEDENAPYKTRVRILRKGDFPMPVEVEFTFEGGEVVRETWDAQNNYVYFEYSKDQRLEKVHVDPERKVLLDLNPIDNIYYLEPISHKKTAMTWTGRIQALLTVFGF